MPTVDVIKGWIFYFYSNEHNPPHIHFSKGEKSGKIEIESLEFGKTFNLSPKDVSFIKKTVRKNQKRYLKLWYEHLKDL